ncbi:MAG TPA: NADH-quinone oxidoreductase subunit C [Acidobacteriota bacterium]|jgi:NADH-quinone oxidoreductase subunit C
MSDEKNKSKDQEPTSSGEKPKKQPKIWVKPGASAAPPLAETPAASPAASTQEPETPAAPVEGEKQKKQPKVWVKPGAAAPQASASAPAAAPPAPARVAAKAAEAVPARNVEKAEAPSYLDISQDPLVLRLSKAVPDAVQSAQSYLNQKIFTVDAGQILSVCEFLKEDPESDFDLLEDLTALDYPEREKRFVVIYQLCSIRLNQQVRLRCNLGVNEQIASVTPVWKTADWLEREVYDMFGIVFSGHPDPRRILLPYDWIGFPLRKDYDLRKQDEDWIRRHLQIRK